MACAFLTMGVDLYLSFVSQQSHFYPGNLDICSARLRHCASLSIQKSGTVTVFMLVGIVSFTVDCICSSVHHVLNFIPTVLSFQAKAEVVRAVDLDTSASALIMNTTRGHFFRVFDKKPCCVISEILSHMFY